MEHTQILKKNPDMTARVFDGETVLIPLYASSKDADFIYVLDDIGTAVWGLVNGKRDIGAIQEVLLEEYDVSPERLRKSVSTLVRDLEHIRALV